jgi:hypothetical protein
LQPQRLSQRLVLLPTRLVALTSNVAAAAHHLSDARPTVGKRLDALLLLECDRWRSGVISPGRYAFGIADLWRRHEICGDLHHIASQIAIVTVSDLARVSARAFVIAG